MRAFDEMRAGRPYFINDEELCQIRFATRDRVDQFNALNARDTAAKRQLISAIFADVGEDVHFEKGLRVDYGRNTRIGSNVFINFNFVLLDCAPVQIGSNVFIGPDVQIYSAIHPLDPRERNLHLGSALPITIGNNVWIGGGAIILPGVTVGDGTTIGAGSVVSRSIPADSVACGNPCRVIKSVPHKG